MKQAGQVVLFRFPHADLESGLKASSVIRIGRLAAVEGEILLGAIGKIAPERLERTRAAWQSG